MTHVSEPQLVELVFCVTALDAAGETHLADLADTQWGIRKAIVELYEAFQIQLPEPILADDWDLETAEGYLWPKNGPPTWTAAGPAPLGMENPAATVSIKAGCRLFDETLILQRMIGIEKGNFDSNEQWRTLEELLPPLPEQLVKSRFYVGRIVCFTGVLSDGDLLAEVSQLRTTLSAMFGPVRLPERRTIRDARLDHDVRLFDIRGVSDCLGLVYAEAAEKSKRTRDVIHEFLPTAGLLLCKTGRLGGKDYRGGLRVNLLKAESKLLVSLKSARPKAKATTETITAAKELEDHIRAVSQAFNDFIDDHGLFQKVACTLRMNQSKLRELLRSSVTTIAGPLASWEAAADSIVKQIDADSAYFDGTIREAELTLRVLEATASAIRAKADEEEHLSDKRRNELLNRMNFLIAFSGIALALASDDVLMRMMIRGDATAIENLGGLDGLSGYDMLRWKGMIVAVLALLGYATYRFLHRRDQKDG